MTKKHLWEADHPYYCNQGNYFSNECGFEFKSWTDFISEMGDADLDMNLLFRFDWKEDEELPHNGDINYRDGHLLLFFMGQRKGKYTYCDVQVCRADEPAVIEYLKVRHEYLQSLWAPFNECVSED